MTADEEAAYVREVASQKTAALRMSLDAVERQGMPFVGETGGVGPGQGMGEVPSSGRRPDTAAVDRARAQLAQESRRSIPLDPELQRRLDEARRAADRTPRPATTPATTTRTTGTAATRRAPRPERMQR